MIGFAGLSHLGTITSVAVASRGFEVLAFDPSAEVVENLNHRKPPVHEPELDKLLAETHGHKIHFSARAEDLGKCDLVYLSLDVKTNDDNVSDLGPLEALIERVLPGLARDTVVVLLSQVPPGFSRKLERKIRERWPEKSLRLYYQVETLIFGRAVERALHPERYIVGCGDPDAPLAAPLGHLLAAFSCPVLKMRYESAELAKISINMCLVSSIAVANTLAELCEKIGAEWTEIVGALRLDKRIGPHAYLSPGLGIAGGNLERDLVSVCAMAREHGTDARVVEAWMGNNRHRLGWVLRTLQQEVFAGKPDPVLGVWGLAYKEDTHSTKNSPSLAVLGAIPQIVAHAYDPQVTLSAAQRGPKLTQVKTAEEACRGVDALMILTPWKEFRGQDPAQLKRLMKGQVVIDPFGVLDPKACARAGLRQLRLGSMPPV